MPAETVQIRDSLVASIWEAGAFGDAAAFDPWQATGCTLLFQHLTETGVVQEATPADGMSSAGS